MSQGDSILPKLLRFVVLVGGGFVLIFTGILDLTWPQQAVLGLLTVLLAIWMDRSSSSYLVTLTLMLASMYSTFRYGFWRLSYTIKFFHDPGNTWSYTRRVLHLGAGGGGDVCVLHLVPGIHADDVAAAPYACAAAG